MMQNIDLFIIFNSVLLRDIFKSTDFVTTMFNITDDKLLSWQDLNICAWSTALRSTIPSMGLKLSHTGLMTLMCCSYDVLSIILTASWCNDVLNRYKSVIDGSVWSGLFHRTESRVHICFNKPLDCATTVLSAYVHVVCACNEWVICRRE